MHIHCPPPPFIDPPLEATQIAGVWLVLDRHIPAPVTLVKLPRPLLH
jgi:hypothetical protein